jgi:hypothetical protein
MDPNGSAPEIGQAGEYFESVLVTSARSPAGSVRSRETTAASGDRRS